MKIVWLLPFVHLTGGVKVVFEYAERLTERGHEVTVVYPGRLAMRQALEMGSLERALRQLKYRLLVDGLNYHEGRWFRPRHFRLKRLPTLESRYRLSSDVTIATSFETAEYLELYPDTVGQKFYLVQGYETWVAAKARVDRTLRSKRLKKIVVSSYLKAVVRQLGERSHGPLLHGIDAAFARPPEKPPRLRSQTSEVTGAARPVVLMQYHELAVKGLEDGLEAVAEARLRGAEFRLRLFGQFRLREDLKPIVEGYVRSPSQAEIPRLYQAADIFLWPSRQEGFGLPVLEAMAAGCAVVTTKTGAVSDLGRDGVHFLTVRPEDPAGLTAELCRLVRQPKLRRRLGRAASVQARKFSWRRSVRQLERILDGRAKLN